MNLLKCALTNTLYGDHECYPLKPNNALRRSLIALGRSCGIRLLTTRTPTAEDRAEGKVIPPFAHTAVGRARLDHLQHCLETVVRDGIAGDVIETGIWRGGTVIFMRAALNVLGERGRTVWAADSFAGLPKPRPEHSPDAGARWHTRRELAVDRRTVEATMERYGLREGVSFLEGWFADTLPHAPIERLAIIRLDGDMYGSTIDALQALYPKLQPGGFLVIDDYYGVNACASAVDDYRAAHQIEEPIERVDWTCAYWRRRLAPES